jgi:hypothetical protein
VAIALIASGCSGSGASDPATASTTDTTTTVGVTGETTISSDDDNFSIVLPEGVSAEGITIADAPPPDFNDGYQSFGSYELGPDGVQFDEPITLEWRTGITSDGESVPVVGAVVDHGDGYEPLDDLQVTVEGGEAVLRGTVRSFSKVVAFSQEEPSHGHTLRVSIQPAAFTSVLDDGAIVLARVDGDCSFCTDVRLPTVEPDHEEKLTTRIVEAVVDATAWKVTCRREGTATYTGAVGWTFLAPLKEGAPKTERMGSQIWVFGKATCLHPFLPPTTQPPPAGDPLINVLVGMLRLYLGLDDKPEAKPEPRIIQDAMRDTIFSKMGVMPGLYKAAIDIHETAGVKMPVTMPRVDVLFNKSVFECGATVDLPALGGQVTTVCPEGVAPIPAGEVVVVAVQHLDALPTVGAVEYFTYAAVFESNDDPSDDWQFQGDFDWDLYQGTDRWYELNWDPATQAWTVTVRDGLDEASTTSARALLMGSTIVWVISKDELPAEVPEYRVSAFVHDGSFRPEASGGDVNGANPTEPLTPIQPLVTSGG